MCAYRMEHLSTIGTFDPEAAKRGEHLSEDARRIIAHPEEFWKFDLIDTLRYGELRRIDSTFAFTNIAHYNAHQRKWLKKEHEIYAYNQGKSIDDLTAEDTNEILDAWGEHHNSQRYRLWYGITYCAQTDEEGKPLVALNRQQYRKLRRKILTREFLMEADCIRQSTPCYIQQLEEATRRLGSYKN